MSHYKDHKSKERIFFLCDECLWSMTSLDKSHVESIIGKEDICPLCNQDQLSSFPITINDTFSYQYSEKTGVDVKFAVQKNDQLIQRNKGKYPIQFLDFGV